MTSPRSACLPVHASLPARSNGAFRALDHHPRHGRQLPYWLTAIPSADRTSSVWMAGRLHSDFTSLHAGATDTALGLPLTVNFQLLDEQAPERPLPGLRVRLWHGTDDGQHSLLVVGEHSRVHCTGAQAQAQWQVTDTAGRASFITLFPGHYAGHRTQIRFEVHAPGTEAPGALPALPVVGSAHATRHQARVGGHNRSGYEVTLCLALAS